MKIVEHFLEHLCALTVFLILWPISDRLEPHRFQHYVIFFAITLNSLAPKCSVLSQTIGANFIAAGTCIAFIRAGTCTAFIAAGTCTAFTSAETSAAVTRAGTSSMRSRTSFASTSSWRTFARRSASPCSPSPTPLFYSGSPPQNQRRDLHDLLGKQ